jgi:hypothetical protein
VSGAHPTVENSSSATLQGREALVQHQLWWTVSQGQSAFVVNRLFRRRVDAENERRAIEKVLKYTERLSEDEGPRAQTKTPPTPTTPTLASKSCLSISLSSSSQTSQPYPKRASLSPARRSTGSYARPSTTKPWPGPDILLVHPPAAKHSLAARYPSHGMSSCSSSKTTAGYTALAALNSTHTATFQEGRR